MQAESEPRPSSRQNQGRPVFASDPRNVDKHMHQSSVSSLGLNDQDHWNTPTSSQPGDFQPDYVSSPEPRHANIVNQDGRSISTTGLSSNTAGKSTPESQQTSNTSYRDADQNTHKQEGNDSFYWHSGRSSSDAEDERSQNASPAATAGASIGDHRSSATNSTLIPRDYQNPSHPIRSTSLSPSIPAPYGASALGLGGPSDWEYFGDYEAEEIDDEDLYTKPKPKDSSSFVGGSAELPADLPPGDDMHLQSGSRIPAAEPYPRRTSRLPDESFPKRLQIKPSQESVAHKPVNAEDGDYGTCSKSLSDQSPETPRAFSKETVNSSDISPEQRLDMDEVIRAWSEAPYIGKLRDSAPHVEDIREGTEEPTEITEASLASTPRERILGVDAILRDAPSMPALPASNFEQSSEERSAKDSDTLEPPLSNSLGTHDVKPRVEEGPLSEQADFSSKDVTGYLNSETGSLGTDQKDAPVADTPKASIRDRTSLPARPDEAPEESLLSQGFTTQSPKVTGHENRTAQTSAPALVAERPTSPPVETSEVVASETCSEAGAKRLQHAEGPAPRQESQANSLKVLEDSLADSGSQQSYLRSTEVSVKGISLSNQEASHNTESRASKTMSRGNLSEALNKASIEPSAKGLEDMSSAANHNDSLPKVETPVSAGGAEKSTTQAASTDNKSSRIDVDRIGQRSPSPAPATAGIIESSSLKVTQSLDPYGDLDPWGRASLNRFAAMLREEARAETYKDKLNIFNVFTSRESRLRVVLYGTEDELIIPQIKPEEKQPSVRGQETWKELENSKTPQPDDGPGKDGFVQQTVERANTITLQRSLKALPALPANRESVIGLPSDALAPLVIQSSAGSPNDHEKPESESPSDDIQYSPGGRPVVPDLRMGNELSGKRSSRADPIPSDGVAAEREASRSPNSSAPITHGSEDAGNKKPAYVPPKYRGPRSEVKNYLANRKSVIRPYATRTHESMESGSSFGRDLNVTVATSTGSTTTAPTSQYNLSSQLKEAIASEVSVKPKVEAADESPDRRRFVKADFDPLLTVLPQSEATINDSASLVALRNTIESVPDDFSFIHQSVVAWDAKAKKQREENDRQRHARQIESEQKIDSLFDDHEIGYGDISELEAEFKRSEAARRADEDRLEYQTFVSDVFNLVWTRLHYELDQLNPHYEQYSKLMSSTLAGKDMFESSSEGLALAPTMSSFLILHQKIEIRHQKAFEAVLERDRRLKKTEISPWYTLSNIAKVKQLEKRFEDAEKKAIIEYCQQRDTRANCLMDVLDKNTLRGLGANQDYMESIMKAVRRIASGRAFASVTGSSEPTAGIEEVEKAKAITALLAISSEQIVQTFHVADMLLNSADYEVSVAKAKVAKADTATLAKLKEERAKEDQKLMRDLEHRLALIREDSRRTNDEIIKLMLFLGVQNGRADGTATPQLGASDPGHEARIQKALEEAKRRNASKESG